MIKSATFRLTGLYLGLFTVSMICLFGFMFYVMRATLHEELKKRILDEVNFLSFEYKEDGLPELIEETRERIEKSQGGDRLFYFLQNDKGQVIFDPLDKIAKPYGWSIIDHPRTSKSILKQPLMLYSVPLNDNHALAVGGRMTSIIAVERVMLKSLIWTLFGIFLAGGVGGYILSRRALSQVRHITNTAQKIGSGSLSERIPLSQTSDELDILAATLNSMFDQIELLMNSTKNVVSSIAHDLRTPLSRIRQKLESLANEKNNQSAKIVQDTISELDNLNKTFTAILSIAEINSGVAKSQFIDVNLSELICQISEIYEPVIAEKGGTLSKDIEHNIFIKADKHLLQQLMTNLVENSIIHSTDHINVSISLVRDGSHIFFMVADNGLGIQPGQRDNVFKPFFQVDPDVPKKGSGLGLSLVASICKLHGMQVWLEDNQPGLRVVIKFPVFS